MKLQKRLSVLLLAILMFVGSTTVFTMPTQAALQRPTFTGPENNSRVSFGNVTIRGRNPAGGALEISVRDVTGGVEGALIVNRQPIGSDFAWSFRLQEVQ